MAGGAGLEGASAFYAELVRNPTLFTPTFYIGAMPSGRRGGLLLDSEAGDYFAPPLGAKETSLGRVDQDAVFPHTHRTPPTPAVGVAVAAGRPQVGEATEDFTLCHLLEVAGRDIPPELTIVYPNAIRQFVNGCRGRPACGACPNSEDPEGAAELHHIPYHPLRRRPLLCHLVAQSEAILSSPHPLLHCGARGVVDEEALGIDDYRFHREAVERVEMRARVVRGHDARPLRRLVEPVDFHHHFRFLQLSR